MSNPDITSAQKTGAHVVSHSGGISFGSLCGGPGYKPGSGSVPTGFHVDPVYIVFVLALCCLFSRNKRIWRTARAVAIIAAIFIGVRMLFLILMSVMTVC